MEQRHLGRSGLTVSRLGLGTLMWGQDTDLDEAAGQLVAFVEAGGTLIDTAAGYAGGESERVLGRLLGNLVSRDELVIATKAGCNPEGPRRFDASRRQLLAGLDKSLRHLQVDHIDLWQLAGWDDRVPLEETLAAADAAVASGRVRYVGVANYAGWQLAMAATWQRAGGGRNPIVSTQVEYSLLARGAESEVLPAGQHLGIGVLASSPLAKGVLTGKYRTGIPADSRGATQHLADSVRPYLEERCRGIVESVATAADGLGVSPLTVALSWVRDRQGVTAAVLGARTSAQLTGALKAEDVTLPKEIREALDDVSAAATT